LLLAVAFDPPPPLRAALTGPVRRNGFDCVYDFSIQDRVTMFAVNRILPIVAVISVLVAAPRSASADLIVNGGFETADLTGWTQSGNAEFTGVSFGNAHTGDWALFSGPFESLGFISQHAHTTPGVTYVLTYFLQSDGSTPNEFQARLGTNTVDFKNLPEFDYTEGSVTFTATDTNTLVRFGFRNDNGAFFLDDVSLKAVPEPGTLCLFAIGGAGLLFRVRRRMGQSDETSRRTR
jgi:hypothetical protein